MSSFPALWVCVSSDHYIIHSWRVFLSPSGVTLGSQARYSHLRPPEFFPSTIAESLGKLRTNVSQKTANSPLTFFSSLQILSAHLVPGIPSLWVLFSCLG